MAKTKPAPKKRKTGRPSLYSEVLAAEICRRLAEGETLRSVCRDKEMPDKATVLRWLGDKAKTDFRDQYAHARDMQADALFDEALEIADDASGAGVMLPISRIILLGEVTGVPATLTIMSPTKTPALEAG